MDPSPIRRLHEALTRVPALHWVLLVAAALLPYLGSLRGDFVAGDLEFILENPVVKSADLVRDAFAHSYWYVGGARDQAPYYRPLIVLLDGLNFRQFGEDPFGYHLTNLLLHLVVSALVLVFTRQLVTSERAALVAATLFAVHPVQVHSVAYISGRTSVLSALWLLLALICIAEAERRRAQALSWAKLYGPALCFGALGLLSKETAVLVPVLATGMLLAKAENPKQALRQHAPWLMGLLLLVAAYLVLRGSVLGHLGSTRKPLWYRLDVFSALLTMAKIVGWYPIKLAFPTDLSYLPPFVPALEPTDVLGLFWLLVLIALTAWVLWPQPARRDARFWTFWFLLTLLPVCGLFSLEYFVKEHHAYLPAVGFCALLGLSAERGMARLEARDAQIAQRAGAALLVTTLLALGLGTASHAQTFADTRALFGRAVELEPQIPESAFAHPAMNKSAQRFAVVHLNLALLDMKDGSYALALPNLTRAAQLARSDEIRFKVLFLRGDCHKRLRDWQRAKADFTAATQLDPQRPEPVLELAALAHYAGNAPEEQRLLVQACELGVKKACR